MPFTWKTRVPWRSIVLTIPRKFAEIYDIDNEGKMEIMRFGRREFNIIKAMMPQSQKGVK